MIGLDLSTPTVALRGAVPVPLLIDFVEGRYQRQGVVAASFTDLPGASFNRSGVGLVPRADGTLATAAANTPRITDRGLLLETEATNLFTHSNDFANAVWAGVGTRVGGFPAPDGANTAVEITMPNMATVLVRALTGAGVTGGISGRVFVKSGDVQAWNFLVRNNTTAQNLNEWSIDLSTNPSGTVNGWTVTPMAGGWFEVAFTRTLGIGAGDTVAIYYGNAGANQNGRKLQVWGANFFQSATPGSPIPTGASPVTRGADIANITVPANATSWEAVHGDANIVVGGSVTPGATFDLVTGRPWLNGFLKRLTMR